MRTAWTIAIGVALALAVASGGFVAAVVLSVIWIGG
jgi:hypothetical protein